MTQTKQNMRKAIAEYILCRDYAAAGLIEKDLAAVERMELSAALVSAGSHYYHPLTGRCKPVPRDR